LEDILLKMPKTCALFQVDKMVGHAVLVFALFLSLSAVDHRNISVLRQIGGQLFLQ
jgi:hypothetical protein